MQNIHLLLWITLGTFALIECVDYDWQDDPWYGKNVHKQWTKVSDTSSDDSTEHGEQYSTDEESDCNSDSTMNFSSEPFEDPPETWPCLYKDCRGKAQAPINIDTEAITTDEHLGPLTFENFDTPLSNLPIKNVGFGTAIPVPLSANVIVTSDWLGNSYRLFAITFSYGRTNENGSLHAVDSKYYPFEMVSLFLNTKYDKLEYKPDAVLYLNVLYQIGDENKAIKTMAESLPDIKEIDSCTTLKSPIIVKDLLPIFPEQYIAYKGSLMLPPCTEGQKVIVFHYSNTLSQKQLEKFRNLDAMKNGRDLSEESRPIQPLNDRKILSSSNGQKQKDWRHQQSSQQYWE